MKKVKLKGKLTLNKHTITRLNDKQMGAVYGGSAADPYCFETEECGISVAGERAYDCQGTSVMIWCDQGETLANNQSCDAAQYCQTSSPCESATGMSNAGTLNMSLCTSCIPNQ